MLRLSQEHATGKWLHLKQSLSTSTGENKVCLKEKEELVGGGLTQMAHVSFFREKHLPDTTFYSSHQTYFLSFTNTPCFWIWSKTADRFRTQWGDSHGWAEGIATGGEYRQCSQVWQCPPLKDLFGQRSGYGQLQSTPVRNAGFLSHIWILHRLTGLHKHPFLSHFHSHRYVHPKA